MKSIFQLFVACGFLVNSGWAMAEVYKVDPGHSEIQFRVKHLGISTVKGTFGQFTGTFDVNPKDLSTTKTHWIVKIASVDTKHEKRDAHLRGEDFFTSEKFPTATFDSTKVTDVQGSAFKLHGNLTIRGVTKPIVFAVEFGGVAKDPWGGQHAAFSARGTINRKDFGMTWNETLDAGGLLVGDEVKLEIEVEGSPVKKAAPEKAVAPKK